MATNTKKVLEEDFTKNPQATTAADVNNQDTATRLWQSLKNTYGNQMEESDKAYDKAISQQSNADMARGMGRSSYASQIRASMYNDKANARNKLGESLIADYQNRIGQLEEAEAARNFQREERVAGQDFQAGQAALNREHETALQTSSQKWQSGESALNRESQERLQESSQNFQMALQKAQNYFNAEESEKARQAQKDLQESSQKWQSGENAANRALTQQQIDETHLQNTIANQQWQQSFNAQQDQNTIANQQWEQSFNAQQNQNAIQNAFNEKQLQMQQDRWKTEFDYNEKSNLQKISMEKVMAIIQNGNDPDDTLLGQAGMTRAEANGMKAQVQSGGGGNPNPGPGNPGPGEWNEEEQGDPIESMASMLESSKSANAAQNTGWNNKSEDPIDQAKKRTKSVSRTQ